MSPNWLKGFIAVLLFLTPLNTAAYAADNIQLTQINFIDVRPDYWANNAIQELSKTQVISGYEDGSFRPEKFVTREEFASLIAKTFYLDLPAKDAAPTYYDVAANRWSFPYIEASKDFLTGYYPPSGKAIFNPTLDATREDVAVALVKTLGYQPEELQNPKILDQRFYDVGSISPGVRTYVALAVEKQLFDGYPNGSFRGDKQVTRAEVASLLHRVIKSASADVKNTGLRLDVIVPETISSPTFYISGETEPGATVTINGKQVEVRQGQFKEGVRIDQGEGTYKIAIVARVAGGKSKTVTKEIKFEKGGPQLVVNDIPEQTNKQSLNVSWSVKDADDARPVVYINDEAQSSYSSSKTIELAEGVNTITFKAVNSLGKSTVVTKTISLGTGAPTLKLTQFPETTEQEKVDISWSVSDKNDTYPKVYVNDQSYSYLNTRTTLTLEPGNNNISIKAVNASGKQVVITKTIAFNPPAPKLTLGYVPRTTTVSSLGITWTVNDKNDSYPKIYLNDVLQDSWYTSKTLNLVKGANPIKLTATNKYGKQTSVTETVYKD